MEIGNFEDSMLFQNKNLKFQFQNVVYLLSLNVLK